jgi:hypothetical protein
MDTLSFSIKLAAPAASGSAEHWTLNTVYYLPLTNLQPLPFL